MKVIFCHGLESGPHGRKYYALEEAGFDVLSPDFRGQNLATRVETLTALLLGFEEPVVLVGSSYGGITAVLSSMAVSDKGTKIHGLVLCAPALEIGESPNPETELQKVAPTVIIHGVGDDVVPIGGSRRYAETRQATLLEVDDDHRLSGSLELIVSETRKMLGSV
mgnify:CR=1 FL=1